jgi:hypothetical protein
MALRKSKFAATSAVSAENTGWVLRPDSRKEAQYSASVLLRLICEMADAIVKGEATHVTLGMPQAKNALLLTVNWADKSQSRAGGLTVPDLIENAAKELLDTGGGEGA